MNRLLKAGLVSLVLATQSLANPEAPINDNHRDWIVASQATKRTREENKLKINYLEERLLERALTYKEKSDRVRNFTHYPKVGWDDVTEIFRENRYCTIEVIPDLLNVLRYDGIEMDPQGRKHFIEEQVRKMSKEDKIIERSKKYFKSQKIDCKVMSSMALAFNLRMQENTTVELVSGIFFDKKHSPNGTAHQWIQIGDFIIDPAIELKTENYKYIPMVSTVFIKYGNNIKVAEKPKIYCISQEMHREYMKLDKK